MGLYNLIDTNLLKVFGEDTVVPIKGALGTLCDDIAPIEKSPAQAARAVGEYIMWGGVLYKVKAPIAVGDTLDTAVNIEKTQIVNEMNRGGGGSVTVDTEFYKYISDTDYKKITHADDKIYWVVNSNGQHGVYKNDVLVEGTDVVNA